MMPQVQDIKCLFKTRTLSIAFDNGEVRQLPFNFIKKKAGIEADITSMHFCPQSQDITLYFANEKTYSLKATRF